MYNGGDFDSYWKFVAMFMNEYSMFLNTKQKKAE